MSEELVVNEVGELIELETGILDGVSKPTIEKLKKAGITTLQALSVQVPKTLAESAGMGEDTADRAIAKAVQAISEGFITGLQLRDKHKKRLRLTTGSKELDKLLGGGIETETTLEISGEFGSGKTQICHLLAVLAQQPEIEGGLGSGVAWIDTEDTFKPERIEEICNARDIDPEETLAGIRHALAYNTPHQKLLTNHLFKLCPEHNIKLVIVDSILGCLRSEYVGRGTLSARQDELKKILRILMKVTISTKATVVYTNQAMGRPNVMYGDPNKPTGGHIMGHAASTRIWLRKAPDPKRIARLIDSSYLPPGEAPFQITASGIEDIA